MSLRDKVQDEINKLYKLCNKNGLTFHFSSNSSPAVMTILPKVTDDMGQEKLFEIDDGKRRTASDAKIEIIFDDGDIVIQTSSAFVIDDSIMSKAKLSAKKIFSLFTWLFFDDTKKLPNNGLVVDESLFIPDEADLDEEDDEEYVETTEEAEELESEMEGDDSDEELEDSDSDVTGEDGEESDTLEDDPEEER